MYTTNSNALLLTGLQAVPLATAIAQPLMVPEFIPGTLTAHLDGKKATFADGLIVRHIDLSPTTGSAPRLESLTQTLRVSWYRPSRTIWLQYPLAEKAAAAVEQLKDLKPENTVLETEVHRSRRGCFFSVPMTGDDGKITEEELRERLPKDLQPLEVRMGKMNYDPNVNALDVVRSYVEKHSTAAIVKVQDFRKSNDLKAGAEFSFDGNPDLIILQEKLDGLQVRELGKTCLHAHGSLCLKLLVDKDVFAANYPKFVSINTEAWMEKKVKIRWNKRAESTTISVFAIDRRDLAHVKARLDRLFSTDILSPCVEMKGKQMHRIRLTKATAYRDAKKAFEEARRIFGEDLVAFDDDSNPPAITVLGGSTLLRKVQKHLRGDSPAPKSKTIACVICLDEESDNFVKLSDCGHPACTDCLRQYCMTDAKFPLGCFQTNCQRKITLRELQGMLSTAELVKVLSESILDHLRRHPEEFKQCPGVDCSNVYRRSEGHNKRQLCHKCLFTFCAHCNVPYHQDMSCEDYQRRVVAQEQEFVQWQVKNGAKQCPKCKTVILKTEDSCNNMACEKCGAHFCWVCLELGSTHQQVYQHLTTRHGRWYDREEVQWENMIGDLDPVEVALNGLQLDDRQHAEEAALNGLQPHDRRRAQVIIGFWERNAAGDVVAEPPFQDRNGDEGRGEVPQPFQWPEGVHGLAFPQGPALPRAPAPIPQPPAAGDHGDQRMHGLHFPADPPADPPGQRERPPGRQLHPPVARVGDGAVEAAMLRVAQLRIGLAEDQENQDQAMPAHQPRPNAAPLALIENLGQPVADEGAQEERRRGDDV